MAVSVEGSTPSFSSSPQIHYSYAQLIRDGTIERQSATSHPDK
jgi:hypothetical protein